MNSVTTAAWIISLTVWLFLLSLPPLWGWLGECLLRAAVVCGALSITLSRVPKLFKLAKSRAARIARKRM